MPNQRMDFDLKIKTSADLQGLDKLKQSLKELRSFNIDDLLNLRHLNADNLPLQKLQELDKELFQIKHTASQVDEAFNKAFDTKLGRTNLQALNKELNKIGINKIRQDFAKMGTAGNQAFIQLAHSATTTSLKLKESVTLVDKLGVTLANTVRWQISTAILNKFVGSFQEAWGYSKKLDSSLNDIRIVTGKSADEMERFAEVANKAAQGLGAATTDYTKAALIYYQQGLSDEEAQARADVTIKAANVTGQSADTVSEQLTAVWNGYKVSAQETELYIDKLAAVAASTAADLEELSTGMSKVAAAANAMGVDIDQLNAQLATIVSATRQAPESVGTALKTVYARMSTISAGGIDEEDGATLTSYTEKMNKFGINVLDANSHLRDMGDVIEEIGGKWNTFNREQQVSLAQAMAGTRQYNNLLALFENFDKYQEALKTSQNSLGTLQKQQDIYMEQTKTHLQQLSTAAEGVFQSLIDNKDINKLIDGLTSIVKLVNQFVDAIGGGKSVLLGLGTVLTTIFSKNIAQTISPVIQNMRDMRNAEIIKADQINATKAFAESLKLTDDNVSLLINKKSELVDFYSLMTNEEINAANAALDDYAALLKEKQALEDTSAEVKEFVNNLDSRVLLQQNVTAFSKIDFTKENFGLNEDDFERVKQRLEVIKDSILEASENLNNFGQKGKVNLKELDSAFEGIKKDLDLLRNRGFSEEVEKICNTIEALQNPASGASVTQSDIDVLKQKIVELAQKAEEAGVKIQTALEIRPNYTNLSAQEQQLLNSLNLSELAIRKNIKAITELASSITGVAFGVSSLSSMFDSFSDGRILQGITGLVFGLRSLAKGIGGILAGIDGIVKIAPKLLLLSKAQLSIEGKRLLILKLEQLHLVKKNTLKAEELTLETALAAVGAKRLITMAAALIIVGALVARYKAYTKYLEEAAKADKEQAELSKKNLDAKEEERKKLSELADAYKKLLKEKEAGTLTEKELRQKAFELCNQYDQQKLAVDALTMSYAQLEDAIIRVGNAANNETVIQGEQTQQYYKNAIKSNIEAKAKSRIDYVGGVETLDIRGLNGKNTSERELIKELQEAGIQFESTSGQMNLDSFINLLNENPQKINEILAKYSNTAAQDLKSYINEISDLADGLSQTNNALEEAQKSQIKNNFDVNEVKDLATYSAKLKEITQEALDKGLFDSEDAARSWAQTWMAAYDELIDYITQEDASNKVLNKVNDLEEPLLYTSNEIEDALSKMKEYNRKVEEYNMKSAAGESVDWSEIDFEGRERTQQIYDYAKSKGIIESGYAAGGEEYLGDEFTNLQAKEDEYKKRQEELQKIGDSFEDFSSSQLQVFNLVENGLGFTKGQSLEDINKILDDFKNNYDEVINHVEQGNLVSGITSAVMQEDVLSSEQISKLYEDGLEEIINISEQEFNNLSDEDKKHLLARSIFGSAEDWEASKQIAIDQLNTQSTAIANAAKQFYDNNGIEEIENKKEEDRTEKEKELLKIYQEYSEVLANINEEIERINKEELGHTKVLEVLKGDLKNTNTQLDNLQSSYKTLSSITEEYSKKGYLTIDSLQSLIALGPEYVACLELENGQLKLNKEAYVDATKAQLYKMQYDLVETANTYALSAAKGELTADELAEINTTLMSADASKFDALAKIDSAIATAQDTLEKKKGALANFEYAGTTGLVVDKLREEVSQLETTVPYLETVRKEIQLINGTVKNVNTKNLDTILGANSKKKKELDDEFDRYWDIKNAIEGVADALERVEDLQSHLHGKELIKSLENENALLEQQAGYYEQLADAQAREASELQAKLAAYGAIFDQSGQLLNYASLTASAVAAYNGGADEESYNEFKKLLERYDALYYNEMKDTQDKLRKLRNQIIENNLKKWETEVSLKLDLKQAERDWNDFLKDINEDFTLTYKDLGSEFANIMKDLDTYMGNSGTLAATMKAIKDIEKEIDIMMAGGSSDKFFSVSDAQEKLKEYMEKLEDSAKNMKQLYEDAWDALLDGIDQAADKFDDLIEKFELIDSELEYQGQLISLLYGDKAYDLMNKLFTAQEISSMAQIKSLQQQKEMWAKMLSEVEEGTEEWQKYYENLNEAQSDLNNLVTEYIELLQKDYLNTVTDILSKLEIAISGAPLDDIALNWERIANNSKKYFDAVEGGFKIQSLANKIKESISETDDIKAQQKLQNLYDEEITALRKKKNLTQYDVDFAEAKYQILLKTIALEEAQNNKTNLKLTRNSQGNWTYQYAADEDDIVDKQNDLNDAYAKLYDLVKSTLQENDEDIIDLVKEYREKTAQYSELALTDKEKATKLQSELDTWYFDQLGKLAEQNTKIMKDLDYAKAESFKYLTEQDMENARIENEYVLNEYAAAAQKIADLWNADNGASVKSQILKAHDSISNASMQYEKKVDEVAKVVKEDFGTKGIKGAIDAATASTQELQGETEKLRTQAETELEIYRRYVEDCASAWDSAKNATVGALEEAQEYLKKVGDIAIQTVTAIEAIAGAWKAAKGAKDDYGSIDPNPEGDGTIGFTLKNMQTGAFLNRDYEAAYQKNGGSYLLTFDSGESITLTQAVLDAFIELLKKANWKGNLEDLLKQARINATNLLKGGNNGVARMATMASGGYTGSWGDDGRLAVLHEKELVLNKDDTENLLNAINTIRGFGSNIESMVASKIMKLAAAISVPIVQGQVTNTSSTSSNNTYNITAEFPDVTSASEIEEALLSLNNYATQYVWNKQ